MSVVDTAKDVYDLVKKGATLEIQEKLMRLREEALELQEENLELRKRLGELEAAFATSEKMQFDGRVYWHMTGNDKDGPFCQRCFDTDRKSVRLQPGETRYEGSVNKWWECKSCSSHFDVA